MRLLSATDAINPAIEHAKGLLRPFSLKLWLKIGLVAMLAEMGAQFIFPPVGNPGAHTSSQSSGIGAVAGGITRSAHHCHCSHRSHPLPVRPRLPLLRLPHATRPHGPRRHPHHPRSPRMAPHRLQNLALDRPQSGLLPRTIRPSGSDPHSPNHLSHPLHARQRHAAAAGREFLRHLRALLRRPLLRNLRHHGRALDPPRLRPPLHPLRRRHPRHRTPQHLHHPPPRTRQRPLLPADEVRPQPGRRNRRRDSASSSPCSSPPSH